MTILHHFHPMSSAERNAWNAICLTRLTWESTIAGTIASDTPDLIYLLVLVPPMPVINVIKIKDAQWAADAIIAHKGPDRT